MRKNNLALYHRVGWGKLIIVMIHTNVDLFDVHIIYTSTQLLQKAGSPSKPLSNSEKYQ